MTTRVIPSRTDGEESGAKDRWSFRRGGFLAALGMTLLIAFSIVAQSKAPEADQFVGPPKGTPLTGAALDAKTQEVAGELRCPVCQGLAIGDSPSEMAINMKRQVRELLARGFTEQQILSYFEQSYGQFVLLKPKFQGVTSLVWILPIAVLLLGALIVFAKAKSLARPATSNQQPAATNQQSAATDPYLQRVRDLVEKR
jgi:cytochrome c-type biogenesis protein CcmH